MILVTGATGFLGSELVKQLVNSGKAVRAIKRNSSQVPEILQPYSNIEWVNADIVDYFSLEEAFQGISKVYHCAALVSFDPAYKKQLLKINKEGTAHIVNLALDYGVEKLVHVSSVAALGDPKKEELISESTQWEFDGTQNGYSISKYESEMEVWRAISEGLNAVIVNPSLIVGANAGTKGTGQLFQMIKRGMKFYTNNLMGIVDVEDVVEAMIRLMDSDILGERFILNAQNVSSQELFTEAAKSMSVKAPTIEARPWMLELAWRGASLLSLFTGKNYSLTRESARSSTKFRKYSNQKLLKAFPDFTYKTLNKTLEEIASKLNR
ncbi:NAD-dependent epimerase/dehydratase family protein [Desertivirga brevis]|uniref:NAD-dependent epimerase/dehydratase family protein n=1 Tax=Desertivirga brevis TaxID=2810310 RepID=UPI001A96F9BF|nr:NAD-dependent epimerase/dehydratase family protein [Pedobacter sp. SYSU D00873]